MSQLKQKASVLLRKSLRGALSTFFLCPIDNKLVFIDSMFGKAVSDNAKYYIKYVTEHDKSNLKFIWGIEDGVSHEPMDRVTFIKYKSPKWFYYHSIAKVVLYSHHLYNYMPLRKGQYNILMWHAGGAYKRIGAGTASNSETERRLHKLRNSYINDPSVVFLSSSDYFTKYNIKEVYGFTGRIEKTGMPRNDIFFSEEKVAAAAARVRKSLGLGDAPIILYAPTFRRQTVGAEHVVDIDFDRLVREYEAAHGVRPYILYRCHYYENGKIATQGMVNVSDYPDMQELLCAADSLITDYSSCIWDYSLLARPCYLYVPDLDEYVNKEQGLFTPIESWYGVICRNNDELCAQMAKADGGADEGAGNEGSGKASSGRETAGNEISGKEGSGEEAPGKAISGEETSGMETFKAMAERQLTTFGSYETGQACAKLHKLVKELRKK